MKNPILRLIVLTGLIIGCPVAAEDIPASLASQYWLDRYESILVCNSTTGGAISEVKITEITEHPQPPAHGR